MCAVGFSSYVICNYAHCKYVHVITVIFVLVTKVQSQSLVVIYLASFILQNTAANGRKTAGNRKNMILSKRLSSASVRKSVTKHSCIFWIDPFLSKLLALAFRASNNVLCDKIQAYSKMAKMMKIRQEMIHWIMALALPPDLGDVLCVEFKVLTMQRNIVSKRPSRPGMASLGTRKLT